MKSKLISQGWFKFLSFLLMMVFSIIFVLSVIAILIMDNDGVYSLTYNEYVDEIRTSYEIDSFYQQEDFDDEGAYLIEVYDETAQQLIDAQNRLDELQSNLSIEENQAVGMAEFFYSVRYWAIVICFVSFVLSIAFFAILMASAGVHKNSTEPEYGWDYKIWFDLEIAAFLASSFCAVFVMSHYFDMIDDAFSIIILVMGISFIEVTGTALCMSFAARLKAGKWWEETFIYRVIVTFIIWVFKKFVNLFRRIPMVWKTAVAIVSFALFNMLVIYVFRNDADCIFFIWIFECVIILPLAVYCTYQLKRLKIAAEEITKGDFNYKIKTAGMFWDLKEHAMTLNSIGDGMGVALEERMKSERMKTELISNVSHDIKTPLTSIINYTDLITKEKCDNPNINEYAEVLHRNSERLKRLMEDIIEASKASSGAIDVDLQPCEAGILLTQIAGEYEEKFASKNLNLVLKQPEENICIMADGRRLWRVFDNLFNNIYKYSQEGTRVYATLLKENDRVEFVFKNTSAVQLDIDANELMERFVRADASRNTEGNGLGLNIAKSLTELQKGSFDIEIDGDLFKVIVSFAYIESE